MEKRRSSENIKLQNKNSEVTAEMEPCDECEASLATLRWRCPCIMIHHTECCIAEFYCTSPYWNISLQHTTVIHSKHFVASTLNCCTAHLCSTQSLRFVEENTVPHYSCSSFLLFHRINNTYKTKICLICYSLMPCRNFCERLLKHYGTITKIWQQKALWELNKKYFISLSWY